MEMAAILVHSLDSETLQKGHPWCKDAISSKVTLVSQNVVFQIHPWNKAIRYGGGVVPPFSLCTKMDAMAVAELLLCFNYAQEWSL